MRTFTGCILFFLLFVTQANAQFQFLSPVPGSKYHNADRNIIIREGSILRASSLEKKNLFEIKGSESGVHEFQTTFCRDRKTVLLKPEMPFSPGETVTVTIHDGMEKENGEIVRGIKFSFEIQRKLSPDETEQVNKAQKRTDEDEFGKWEGGNNPIDGSGGKGLPPLYITTNTNPAPGDIFFHNYNTQGIATGHHSIITNDGDSVFSRGSNKRGMDFKLNHNGYLTMFDNVGYKWEMYDSSYNQVAIYKIQNGYLTNLHEMQIYPDGHCWLQAYDTRLIDMTVYDSSYYDHATVVGLVIEELDSDKNLIFEWRSWDHIDITEVLHTDLASGYIDYVHGNSMEEDTDGNLVISCRHLDQINKINISTGEFMWRLGGQKNQFTFINDPEPFNYEHDCRVLPNGHITLFDNGNYHTTPCSYAREYELDLVNKTATLVWYYKHPKVGGADLIGWALGSVQRLANGNTFIDWGFIYADTNFPNLSDVTPNGDIVWEMRLYNGTDQVIYSAHKYDWTPCARTTGFKMKATDIQYNMAKLKWSPATGAVTYIIQYHPIDSPGWITQHAPASATIKNIIQLQSNTTYQWRMKTVCANGDSSAYSILKEFTTTPRLQLNEEQDQPAIYPNPASTELNIKLPGGTGDGTFVRIVNMLGEIVYKSESITGGTQLKIPLQNISAGIYWIDLITGENHWVEKVAIQ